MNQEYIDKVNQLYETDKTMTEELSLWLDYVVFTPYWWITFFLSITPWVLWFFFHKKESRNRMLFAGLGILMVSSFFDFLGVKYGLWRYYYEVFPWIPAFEPWDWTLIPVLAMFLIEIKPHISPYLKGLLFTVLTSLIGEPIFQFMGLYVKISWSFYYSLPGFFLLYLFGHWLSRRRNFKIYWED